MARTPPALTPAEQEAHDRRSALRSGDVRQMRAWAEKYGRPLLGDDAVVEQSMHEARVLDPTMPPMARALSRRWLREHAPDSVR